MCLWYPITRKMEIIMRIHVCHNWRNNIDYKKMVEKNISYETIASMSFIPMRRRCLCCPIMNKKRWLLHASMFVTIGRTTSIPKKWWNKRLFFWIHYVNVIYPNEENVFLVPNHEKKEIICASLFVTIGRITLIPKKKGKKKAFFIKPKHHCHLN